MAKKKRPPAKPARTEQPKSNKRTPNAIVLPPRARRRPMICPRCGKPHGGNSLPGGVRAATCSECFS
jgi:hypothetical protein